MFYAAFEFFLKNLAAPVAFYPVFRIYGAKPAIACVLAVTAGQFAYHRCRRIAVSPILLLASSFTVFFGSMDLLIASPRFFRFEPSVQNFALATIFLISVLLGKPIVSVLVNGLPERLRPVGVSQRYFTGVTLAWVALQYFKAGFFLFMAFRIDLADLIAVRSLLGGGLSLALLGGEIAFRKLYIRARPAAP